MQSILSKNIKLERIKKGLSQNALGQMLGLTQQAIGKWENGLAEPDVAALNKMSEFFDVSVDYLLGKEIKPSAFSPKDEKDISKKMDELMSQLENEKALMFDGEPLDNESKELLLASLENSLRVAKALAKDKYTPKKYRK